MQLQWVETEASRKKQKQAKCILTDTPWALDSKPFETILHATDQKISPFLMRILLSSELESVIRCWMRNDWIYTFTEEIRLKQVIGLVKRHCWTFFLWMMTILVCCSHKATQRESASVRLSQDHDSSSSGGLTCFKKPRKRRRPRSNGGVSHRRLMTGKSTDDWSQ